MSHSSQVPISNGTWMTLLQKCAIRLAPALPTLQWLAGALMVAMGPILAIATTVIVVEANRGHLNQFWMRAAVLACIIYLIAVCSFFVWHVAARYLGRHPVAAGSRLHRRMITAFALVASLPAIIIAIFTTFVINVGLEGWFSQQVGFVVRNSLIAAETYAHEHRQNLADDLNLMAAEIDAASVFISPGTKRFNDIIRQQVRRHELAEAYLLDAEGQIISSASESLLYDFVPPEPADFQAAKTAGPVLMLDPVGDRLRALVQLRTLRGDYLYVSRIVSGGVFRQLDRTRETVALYERTERDRDQIIFDFALFFLVFAVLNVAGAILFGMFFANRLATPLGNLALAAQQMASGARGQQVVVHGDDEIALLGRVFNHMSTEVERQHEALRKQGIESERRRLFSEAVLAGVTAGVIGVDAEGRIELVNRSAGQLLNTNIESLRGQMVADALPMFLTLLQAAQADPHRIHDERIHIRIRGQDRDLVTRIASERLRAEGAVIVEGFVITFDDVTELENAQRMAAWGDVARRIAHEIKNPLTPIQLSAERLRSKFAPRLGEDREAFERYADMIIRQVGDIRRMVDAFSRFAKMPSPEVKIEDLAEVLRDTVLLQRASGTDVSFGLTMPTTPALALLDRGLIGQALTNLLKNALEAIAARQSHQGPHAATGEIRVTLRLEGKMWQIDIADNGIGLPQERRRLTEPYFTTRERGTGLGLAITKKIIEQHGGELQLMDAPIFTDGAAAGALVRVTLPRAELN